MSTHIIPEQIRYVDDGLLFPLTIAGRQANYPSWFRVDDDDLREHFQLAADADVRQHFARIIPLLERAAAMSAHSGRPETGLTMEDAIFVDSKELEAAG